MANHKKRLLSLCMLLVGSCCQGMSIYLLPKNYTGSYIAQGGATVFTASSPEIAQNIQNSGAVPPPTPPLGDTWALNTAKGGNGTGLSSQAIGSGTNTVAGMVVNADGSFVTAGTNTYLGSTYLQVARFLNNGVLDTAGFNTAGTPGYSNFFYTGVTAKGVISDGSGGYYVVGGTTSAGGVGFVTHILSNGTQDTTFGTGTPFYYYAPTGQSSFVGIVRQSSGNAVCVGIASGTAALKTYLMTSAGATVAGSTNYTNSSIPVCCAIDSNNKTLITATDGSNNKVYRLNATATGLDTSFGDFSSGFCFLPVNTSFTPRAMAVLSDNSMVIVGYVPSGTPNITIVKVTSAGILDPSFGSGTGSVTVPSLLTAARSGDYSSAVVVIPEGFAIGGYAYNDTTIQNSFVTVLLAANGSLNTKFSIPGETIIAGTAVVQPSSGHSSSAYAIGYQPVTGSTGLVVTGYANSVYGAAFYKDF